MIQTLTAEIAHRIAATLCERDRREILALLPVGGDLNQWVHGLMGSDGLMWAAFTEDGTPVAMGGATRPVPHLAQTWAVGTARKHEAGVAIFRTAARMHHDLVADGVRKFQCCCLAEDLDCEGGSVWLERLGYTMEGYLRGQGNNGEDFRLWGRVEINHGRT